MHILEPHNGTRAITSQKGPRAQVCGNTNSLYFQASCTEIQRLRLESGSRYHPCEHSIVSINDKLNLKSYSKILDKNSKVFEYQGPETLGNYLQVTFD